ncbi:hypothetical protein Emag_001680 [Eimeria magna]
MAAPLFATATMESPLLPAPRTHTHTIIPHGHTRRVPVEAACSTSLAFLKTVSPQEPLADGSQEVAAVQMAKNQPLERTIKKKSVEFEDDPIPVAITFLPKEETSPRRLDSISSFKHPHGLSADGAESQPTGSWLRCCNMSYVDGPQEETEPEELDTTVPVDCAASPRTENHLAPPQSAVDASCWSPGICGGCSKPVHESISTYTEESLPQLERAAAECLEESQLPVVYAPAEYADEHQTQVLHKRFGPEEVDAVALPEKVVKENWTKGTTKPRGKHIVYIDHYPEPFVMSYFGDDESEQIPDHCADFRFNKATDVLFAAGTALGVVVTSGAVVIGAAALTAGLTVGIAATELYKRVTNNYNI